jgi:hypothetical protein
MYKNNVAGWVQHIVVSRLFVDNLYDHGESSLFLSIDY